MSVETGLRVSARAAALGTWHERRLHRGTLCTVRVLGALGAGRTRGSRNNSF